MVFGSACCFFFTLLLQLDALEIRSALWFAFFGRMHNLCFRRTLGGFFLFSLPFFVFIYFFLGGGGL